jgi:Domain of unknown function (DUF4386)
MPRVAMPLPRAKRLVDTREGSWARLILRAATVSDSWGPMSSLRPAHQVEGITLRQAALIAGFCYLLMPVTLAEFLINPKLLIPGNIEQTAQNIVAHGRLFGAAILCYLITLVLDVVIAWALYLLLVPVNRAASLLAAWFRLIYTAIALAALLNLTTAYRLLTAPDYLAAFGAGPLHAQVMLLLNSYRYDWSMSLTIFGIHLGLLGYLIYRSGYIPRILGILLVLDGLGWIIIPLKPYLYPNANLGFFFPLSFVELLLPLWLVIRGWKIRAAPAPDAVIGTG